MTDLRKPRHWGCVRAQITGPRWVMFGQRYTIRVLHGPMECSTTYAWTRHGADRRARRLVARERARINTPRWEVR